MMSILEGKFAAYQLLGRPMQLLDCNLDWLGQVPPHLGLQECGRAKAFELCTRTCRGSGTKGYEGFHPYIRGSTGTIWDDMAGYDTARHRIR